MKSLTTRKKMETKTKVKIIYLEGRLDDVERELSIITSKKYELEQRRKTLLEKINKLDEQRMDAIPAN
jgi:hypothetical protein